MKERLNKLGHFHVCVWDFHSAFACDAFEFNLTRRCFCKTTVRFVCVFNDTPVSFNVARRNKDSVLPVGPTTLALVALSRTVIVSGLASFKQNHLAPLSWWHISPSCLVKKCQCLLDLHSDLQGIPFRTLIQSTHHFTTLISHFRLGF